MRARALRDLEELVAARVDDHDVAEALKRPADFGYFGDRPMFESWALGPVIVTRDSDLLMQSNAAVLKATLEEAAKRGLIGEDSYEITRSSHWAVGWVERASFQVVDEDDNPTPVFRLIKGFYNALEDYPVADEADWSEREYEAGIESIRQEGARLVRARAPKSWPYDVYHWLSENDPREVEDRDGRGAYPSEDAIRAAAKALRIARR